ncbi:MAG: aspartate carbamoyltransferase catalytic subunit [Woeseia sp.]|nr:aspartate carbamoyltransferase catalytic subunit [Woeseia sp.]MBT8096551.1 aspartate carbamoyltransferase catalytic subunit [Woeseia sp.]NNE61698.1 aspartate carbamoyltransferase catalytic subunit [Woeseia sp.]NNL53841.1 aspartate carbamoyltransferase catalytic subunit [Woeseia sp.]
MQVTELFNDTRVTADSDQQFATDGRLRHLLTLQGIDRKRMTALLDSAERWLSPMGSPAVRSDALQGFTVANLFFEPSTRTRASFDLAARRLGADVLNLDVNTSSRKKGESILDTIYTLQAMQVDVFVIRDASAGVPAYIARHVDDHVSVLNAGESEVSHPTQGLLDLLTIRRHKGDFSKLNVAIVGDIAHSRVARSAAQGLTTMGVGELRLVSPPALAPSQEDFPGARIMSSLDDGLREADVVMALRIQRERIGNLDGIPGIDEYFANYGVSSERLRQSAPDVIVMHPGPMNRGIEIESALADSARSVITEQVASGVAVRMAILCAVTGKDDH